MTYHWPPDMAAHTETGMNLYIDKSIQVSVGAAMSGGPVIHHIPGLVPSVPIVPMGRHRLVCDGPDYGSPWRTAWIGL